MPTISANIIQDAFGPLIKVFETILVFIHAHITGGSWGLAIIGLTIVVRAALVPLTLKQFSSMTKLQALGPELKELQKKYKDDKPRLNEEMMKFYKENEVNPFGSCLPLVLQLPVFLSLFYMLRLDLKPHICGAALKAHHIVSQAAIAKQSCGAIDPNSGKFLFIPDVTTSASGGVLAILIVLYIGSQLVASLLTTATVDRNQRLLMLGLPFVFSIFIAGFPAGLLVYWITTNLWTVGQQYIVKRRSAPILAVVNAATGGGRGGRGGGAGEETGTPAPAGKPPPQKLMDRLAAARDAARSAVTGTSPGGSAGKRAVPAAKGAGARPTPAKAKANAKAAGEDTRRAPGARGGSQKARGPGGARASRDAAAGSAKAGATKGPGQPPAARPGTQKSASGKGRVAPVDPPATTGKQTAGRPGAGKPTAGKPAARKPAAGESTASNPAAGKPAAGRPRAPRGAQKAPADADVEAAAAGTEPSAPRARGAAPPPPPRKKKKRSGRRR